MNLKLNIDQTKLKCPSCGKWQKMKFREVDSTDFILPDYFECDCGRHYGIFKYASKPKK